MGYTNIDERRRYVLDLIQQGVTLNIRKRAEIGAMFGCSYSTITLDIHVLTTKPLARGSFYPGVALKKKIYKRDDYTCQYCGQYGGYGKDKRLHLVIDHVIPMTQGGIGSPSNLVVACGSCNIKKKGKTWIPNNLDKITEGNQYWRDLILGMASER